MHSAHRAMNRDPYLAAATAAATTAFTIAVTVIHYYQFVHGFHLLSNRYLSMHRGKKRDV